MINKPVSITKIYFSLDYQPPVEVKAETSPPTTPSPPSWMGDPNYQTPYVNTQPPQTVPPTAAQYETPYINTQPPQAATPAAPLYTGEKA